MSLVRRVKSFSIKKSTSTEELKSNVSFRSGPRRKKNLSKEKSVSMEYIPIHIELEKSELFNKQKWKREEEEQKKNREQVLLSPRSAQTQLKLKKRKSVSFDEARFSKFIAEFDESDIRLRRFENSERWDRRGSRYNTVAVVKVSLGIC